MGLQIVRFEKENVERWGVVKGDHILVLQDTYSSLAQFLDKGKAEARKLYEQENGEKVSLNEVTFLSPVTTPARIVCQGANYSSHRAESGLEANKPPFNLIFSKADSSLCGAYTEIIRPAHVQLLDYEIELGLIIGSEITGPVEVTEETLHQFVAGLVIFNDVSARDVQLTQGQWLRGKSYRTFGPTGPYFYLLDQEEMPSIHDLEIKLWVNDELRQSANTNQLLFKPAETIIELSEIMDLSKGDLIVTGTTGGVAMNLSKEEMSKVSNLTTPYEEKVKVMLESQLKLGNYLKDGDVIRCSIKSADGTIDLGEQVNKVVPSKVTVS
ncbi:fumarylacetoacetate hydrolase family protein [Neobacillus cucumis]|uniref:fumarylacetoacetate hydrolase family protein n=1 Tax=Neobacillus cucumis TaxID=1740721 RepID=UPI00203E26E3|nr:fumarylacetoacetate hydrolase family protein [Neobacillus cucumis]MCM3729132.1 fumarylacetoacetate hydrolase family protein [Neobacillus cucumis]